MLEILFQMYLAGIVLGIVMLGIYTLISTGGQVPPTITGKKNVAIPSLLILVWPLYIIWSLYYSFKKG